MPLRDKYKWKKRNTNKGRPTIPNTTEQIMITTVESTPDPPLLMKNTDKFTKNVAIVDTTPTINSIKNR